MAKPDPLKDLLQAQKMSKDLKSYHREKQRSGFVPGQKSSSKIGRQIARFLLIVILIFIGLLIAGMITGENIIGDIFKLFK